jgi:hypothetical protein
MSVAVGPKLRCLIKRDGPDNRSRGVANLALWAARKPAVTHARAA